MKKSKFLKPFSFASLALLMGIAGTMAFAPLGASPSVANASEMVETTTEQGLINPKADDPVIYTTESGLQIKYGNATPDTINSSLGSGNLEGFPYFTTKNGSTTYTWVIIGRNSNVTTLNTAVQSYLFSTWKSNNSSSNDWKYSNSFFKNTYETSTPAGSAINNVVPSKSYVNDNISFSINDITTNDNEIPSGCVLALLNTYLDSSAWYITSSGATATSQNHQDTFQDEIRNIGEGASVHGSWCRPWSNCYGYTINDTFGFGSNLTSLQNPTLQQRCYSYVGGTSTRTATLLKFFPLGGSNYAAENFKWESYLTATQYQTSVAVWGRSMYNSSSPYYTNTSGTVSYYSSCKSTAYLRPACILKI